METQTATLRGFAEGQARELSALRSSVASRCEEQQQQVDQALQQAAQDREVREVANGSSSSGGWRG